MRIRLACLAIALAGCPALPTPRPLGPCPVPTAKGVCAVDNYNEQVRCFRMHKLKKPKTVAELQQAIREANAEHQQLRPRGAGHSTTSQICVGGWGVDMKTLHHGRRIVLREENGKTLVETWAGIRLYELADRVYAHGHSIGFSMIGFREVTVGGALANGAHGSALTESTLLASRVRGLTLVDAEARLLHYRWDPERNQVMVRDGTEEIPKKSDPLPPEQPAELGGVSHADFWHALLGLGFVVRLEIEVDDAYWLWVRVKKHTRDEQLHRDPRGLTNDPAIRPTKLPGASEPADHCDFFQVLWYPSAHDLFDGRHGSMITMCGVKVYRRDVPDATLEKLAQGGLGKNALVNPDVLEQPKETEDLLEQLYGSDDGPLEAFQQVGKRRLAGYKQSAADAANAHSAKVAAHLQGPNAVDVQNSALDPHFSGFFASFASQGHEFMNWAWPFDVNDSLFTRHCSFVENQRFGATVFAFKNGKGVFVDDFTMLGRPHRLISSDLANEGHKVTQVDYEVSVSEPEWAGAMSYFEKQIIAKNLCMPMTGIFVRFSKVDESTLVTHNAVNPDGPAFKPGTLTMFLDFVAYAPITRDVMDAKDYKREQDYHEKYRQVAEDLMRKHYARLHWGKNANWWALNQPGWCGKSLFRMHLECSADGQSCDGRDYAGRLARFRKVIDLMDPHGRFENAFARDVGLLRSDERIAGDESEACP